MSPRPPVYVPVPAADSSAAHSDYPSLGSTLDEDRSPSSLRDHLHDRDWIDVLSPNEPGLPIFTASSSMGNPVQVVDSSAARRRDRKSVV